ncbi:MAG: SDR family oxidoreductase [Candidatus Lokiarchaeota archaeon]|nr:SDR family oxidoreductase [Candidatus Lokiarchaeota archaeon]MBD3198635.1 SDR family oxidoreductase [Candidatus Lokiarchaeota archaeon]
MLEDKVILLLGATGGIGSKIATKASTLGAKLICVARNEQKLNKLGQNLGDALMIKGDITKYEDLKDIVEKGTKKFGRIDVLIHAVGSILLKPIHILKQEEFNKTININLTSAFLAIKAVIRGMMRQKSGSVIVISSVAGSKGLRNHEAISAAKGGLESMIRSAAITYASRGIRFNGVALGLVNTPLSASAKLTTSEKALETSRKMHPLGRIGEPKDIVSAILYLASDQSSWQTGTIIPIDGGMNAS